MYYVRRRCVAWATKKMDGIQAVELKKIGSPKTAFESWRLKTNRRRLGRPATIMHWRTWRPAQP